MVDTVTFQRPAISYDSRDYEATRDDLIRSIPFFTPEWTDWNIFDFGIVLIELFSISADVLHFYIDRALFEGCWGTAVTRDSMARLGKLIEFTLTSGVAATVDLTFSLAAAVGGHVSIPKGTLVSTTGEDPVFFETTAAAIITAGETDVTVGGKEGQTSVLPLLVSTGAKDQKFTLTPENIIEGSLLLEIDEGAGYVAWTNKDSLYLSTPTAKEYTTSRDGEDILTVIFGDGSTGKIPLIGSPIRATVRLGGGFYGNVGAGTINTVRSTIFLGPNPIATSVTNPEKASAGQDPMSVEAARIQGPRSFKTLGRAVTPGDFQVLAQGYPGVASALATPSSAVGGDPNQCCCCGVVITVSVTGGGNPSSQLKTDLAAYLQNLAMIGTCIEIADAVLVQVDGGGTIYVGSSFGVATVQAMIETVIANFFAPSSPAIGFGLPIFLSAMEALLQNVAGVDHVDLGQLTRRPDPDYVQWNGNAVMGPVTVGATALDEIWTVTLLTPTTFSVRGSVSGLQTNHGVFGTDYTSDHGEVSFKITAGTVPMLAGDFTQFRTSPRVANVPVESGEIPIQGLFAFQYVAVSRAGTAC